MILEVMEKVMEGEVVMVLLEKSVAELLREFDERREVVEVTDIERVIVLETVPVREGRRLTEAVKEGVKDSMEPVGVRVTVGEFPRLPDPLEVREATLV